MIIRVRSRDGLERVKVAEDATLSDLRTAIEKVTGVRSGEQRLSADQNLLNLNESGKVTLLETMEGLKHGSMVYLAYGYERDVPAAPTEVYEAAPAAAVRSLHPAPACTPVASDRNKGEDLVGVSLPDGSELVKRVIVSDNSCLFNAVGYVMERDRNKARDLRQVVASTVASDPDTYNDVFLEKSNGDYCRWILDPMRWGGAIELSILTKHYQREIAAYDIQTKRVDVYGQGMGYRERALVIYDGLHYDALALSAFSGAPEEVDITLFEVDAPIAQQASQAASALVSKLHDAKQFTDTANFTLRCTVCQQGLRGEKEAQEHAKRTGHVNFAEY
ncbi:putative ubiquitin thioesterase OTU1 [Chloropicon primus]|uniref:Ubiquitin thioesterase OTU n=2 Tax=Chloropicon primus TaxID=1764295 RepID=A0A5B8ME22_9CHLO|nr:putative ubiquitin thioesterase OTU1 [Chloropicon primus]UPQ97624.1 putative ubiquitin thioesterase OTU1 [Chloropicon primus]|eukprot:QDZ18414.1 putative ubiquitin thioesterase OTU1 [Chloropicon primus]